MEKVQYRSVIRFLFLKGMTNDAIKAEMDSTYGKLAPSMTTIKYWKSEFKRGRTSVLDEDRPGRPKGVTTDDIIEKIHVIISTDGKIKLREIAQIVNISYERVHNILQEHLGMKKLLTKWVPRSLTIKQKQQRIDNSKYSLAILTHNPNNFFPRLVTVGETWIHHYPTDSKQEVTDSLESDDSSSKRQRTQQSTGKILVVIFWDSSGIVLIDFLRKEEPPTENYYLSLVNRLTEEVNKKRPPLSDKTFLYFNNNVSSITLEFTTKISEFYEMLPFTRYSPDLSPSDYFLFPNLKRWLQGKRFISIEEIKLETNAYLEILDKTFYTKGIEMLKDRWTRCIELEGHFIEEQKQISQK